MTTKGKKFVRFKDWKSLSSSSIEHNDSNDGFHKRKVQSSVSSVIDGPIKKLSCKINVLDPQGPTLQKWNKIFVITCVMAISVDPLFLYIPVIDVQKKCLDLDGALKITASVLRTFFDLFYILHIIFQFRTGFIAPSSRVFGRGELVNDPWAIVMRYLSSYFIIDILSIIPLPQMVILAIIPVRECSSPYVGKDFLKYTVISQYVPRLLRIYPLFKEVTSTSGILTETAWAGAAYNLFLYMLASHVVGAFWYLFSVESRLRCWRRELQNAKFFHESYLSCGRDNPYVQSLLNSSCPIKEIEHTDDTESFNFGMFIEALKYRVVESATYFHHKFFYCFWWGLRSLSSVGQGLQTSTYVGEIIFAIFIAVFGLVLFASLIGNMQKYLQSTTVRVEEMRIKRRDAELWMSHRMLPELLKQRIRRYEQYKWQENRGVEEETLIRNLPKDLRRDIKRHLCLDLLRKVPMFEDMDNQLLDALCDRLKPVLYTERSYIVREGDPVDEMLFIMRGKLATATTNGGRTGFFNSAEIKAGDFCGEELLTWALDPNSSSNLPISTRTVETISEVEAFALMPEDLKCVASQFRRLINSKQLQHTFRFYSLQWRTWGACFIQAAWRRYRKKKAERALREAEERIQAMENEEGSSPSFAATVYASRFASSALRHLRSGKRNRVPQPQRLLPLMPQKPAEPDFTAQTN
ncbi:cyclic nucleotide-gated ion channel 1 [Cajanus cajan]|uniref:cyclic nucleotide-gated ion channel 1 n=1 Tax=Cajanus cajan TaxID=3821 RepID=UPI00098DA343|nr:cyclic nucleotide-gated ion channel 1 [Cajanus cajan]XP_020236986.1 cyclic nucleotide-gated ion channel 1 [Cajanus cajan]XP_020236987.1 cyclic nucleotide-gated ion channel 1 [Cajanus cajan]XP_020236988.1 cyclic nucleotide-gated ion channel 1 [Cajanus cajan]